MLLRFDHRIAMASALMRTRALRSALSRAYASLAIGSDLVSAAPGVALQKARSWDEGVSSKFSTTPLKDIFKVSPFHLLDIASCFVTIGCCWSSCPCFLLQGKKVVIFGLPVSSSFLISYLYVFFLMLFVDSFDFTGEAVFLVLL